MTIAACIPDCRASWSDSSALCDYFPGLAATEQRSVHAYRKVDRGKPGKTVSSGQFGASTVGRDCLGVVTCG